MSSVTKLVVTGNLALGLHLGVLVQDPLSDRDGLDESRRWIVHKDDVSLHLGLD